MTDPPLRVDYWVLNGGAVEVRIFNVAGLTMRHLVNLSLTPGAYSAYWDGTDDSGQLMTTGLYLVAVREPNRMEIKKVLVVRQ